RSGSPARACRTAGGSTLSLHFSVAAVAPAPLLNDSHQHPLRRIDLFHLHEFFRGVGERDVTRTKTDRRHASLVEESGIGPCRKALDPNRQVFALHGAAQSLDYRCIDWNVARQLRGSQCNSGVELWMIGSGCRTRIGYLFESLLGGLTRQRAPLDGESALLG